MSRPENDAHLERLVPCVNLLSDGSVCGKPGFYGLPAGVCPEHAMKVYRSVVRLGGGQLVAASAFGAGEES